MEVLVHYVGVNLYKIRDFIREASKHGVSRALPLNIVKKLKWGDRIFLAQYDSKGKMARIFGYFTVDGLRYFTEDGNQEFSKAVRERLDVREYTFVNKDVFRICGNYTISFVCYVGNSVEEIATILEELSKEFNTKVKVFVEGELTLIVPVEVPAKFTRSVIKLDIPDEIEEIRTLRFDMERYLAETKDYRQRKYLTKKDKAVLQMMKL